MIGIVEGEKEGIVRFGRCVFEYALPCRKSLSYLYLKQIDLQKFRLRKEAVVQAGYYSNLKLVERFT